MQPAVRVRSIDLRFALVASLSLWIAIFCLAGAALAGEPSQQGPAAPHGLSPEQLLRVEQLEANFANRMGGVEDDFSGFVRYLERRFVRDLERVERGFVIAMQRYEGDRDEKRFLREARRLRLKIEQLDEEVARLRTRTRFLESAKPSTQARRFPQLASRMRIPASYVDPSPLGK